MSSFSEDDGEYASAEESADDILEEIEEQEAEQEAEEEAVDNVLSNAIERIEEANVWKLLISQDVIAPGSASGRVVKSVNSQLKKFGLNRLEILLGMKELQTPKAATLVKPQFDPEEERALRILAAKVLGRSVAAVIVAPDTEPKLNSVPAQEERPEPRLNQAVTQQVPKLNNTKAPSKPAATKPTTPQQKVMNKTPKRTKVPEGAKVDQGYALPGPSSIKPKPMPNIQQQMTMYGMGGAPQMNITADGSVRGSDVNRGSSLLSQVIGNLTGGNMVAVNTNAPEGAGEDINERF